MTAKVDATEHHRVPPRAAHRPEPAARRTRALVQGHERADRVPRRGRGRGRRDQARAREVREGQRRLRRRRRFAARAELRRQVRQEARHRARRLRDRRQGRDRLGHRCRPRPPQRAAQGRLHARDADRLREGRATGLPAETEPRRLEQRRPDDQQPRPLPPLVHGGDGPGRRPAAEGRARDPVDPPREALARADRRRLQLLAHDRPRVQGDQREDRGPRQAAPGTVDVADGPRGPQRDARHAPAQARRLAEARQGDQARRPRGAAPAAGERAADAPDVRAVARRSEVADDLAHVRQPRLADLLRHRPRRDQRRLRHAERGAVASRAARLAGGRVRREGLEAEGPAPADRQLGGVSAELAHRVRRASRRIRTTGSSPAARASAWKARSSATSRSRSAGC